MKLLAEKGVELNTTMLYSVKSPMLVEFYICQLIYKNPNLALKLLKGVNE